MNYKLNYKMLALACFAFPVLLTGCESTQTPYEIDRQVAYKAKRASNYYDFGITEEKVSDQIYFVTAKLEGTSSIQRAKDMWHLHAANLALNNNFDKFASDKKRSGKWCTGTRNQSTGQRSANDGGPRVSGFVLLAHDKSQLKRNKKLYSAKSMKDELEAKVNALLTEQAMSKNSDRFLEACREKR